MPPTTVCHRDKIVLLTGHNYAGDTHEESIQVLVTLVAWVDYYDY